VSIRKLLFVVGVGAAALSAAACTTANGGTPHSMVSPSRTSTSFTKPTPPPTKPATATPIEGTPASVQLGSFSLDIEMQTGRISADVEPISVASNEAVDPPHSTAKEWNTAAWVQQSTFPDPGTDGTSYVYGHACHHHKCPFTTLKDAQVGDKVTVTTISNRLEYVVKRVGMSPKSATALPSWASDSTVPDRLVMVTCAFEQGDTSTENIVVVAQRQN
jgi:LPXTG-site transpeptidase (sortase) family protein